MWAYVLSTERLFTDRRDTTRSSHGLSTSLLAESTWATNRSLPPGSGPNPNGTSSKSHHLVHRKQSALCTLNFQVGNADPARGQNYNTLQKAIALRRGARIISDAFSREPPEPPAQHRRYQRRQTCWPLSRPRLQRSGGGGSPSCQPAQRWNAANHLEQPRCRSCDATADCRFAWQLCCALRSQRRSAARVSVSQP